MLRKLILVLSLIPAMLFAQDKPLDTVALDWLGLVDTEHYNESWDKSGDLFRTQISKSEWVTAVRSARKSVGNLQSRQLTTTKFVESLPNIPDGEYTVFQYHSVFSGRNATETLTLAKSSTGWHVVGYYINQVGQ